MIKVGSLTKKLEIKNGQVCFIAEILGKLKDLDVSQMTFEECPPME